MNIILLGPPGAGKGTEGKFLAKELGLKRLSVGALLRRIIKDKTPIGREVEKYVRKGLNVPADLLFPILSKRFTRNKDGFIIDNFPRSKEQLELLKKLIQNNKLKIDKVFHISVSEKTSLRRLLNRQYERKRLGVQRIDEALNTIENRYKGGYIRDVKEILEYFKKLGILEEIDGEQTIENVHREILRRLGIDG